jgi:hypothetical protein
MPESARVRVEIGFEAGQVLSLLVDTASADALEKQLASPGEGSVSLDADDGLYTIALRKVTYAKRFTRESRVGFGDA